MKKRFEMWFYRRVLIARAELMDVEDVLREIGATGKLIPTIGKRQFTFLGSIMRKEGLENFIRTGIKDSKIRGKVFVRMGGRTGTQR